MGHGRHEPSGSVSSISELIPTQNSTQSASSSPSRKNHKLIILSIISVFLLVSCAISAALLVHFKNKGSSDKSQAIIARKPTQAISKTCSKTRYPVLCVNSLVDFPGSLTANQRDLVHISVNMTLQRVGKALYGASGINNLEMDTRVRSAYEDCLELLEDSVDQLSRSLSSVGSNAKLGSTGDVLTWLSAALTNQDTCTEGFEDVSGNVKSQMELQLSDLSELVSNALAIFSGSSDEEDFAGIPIQNRRRKLLDSSFSIDHDSDFPAWVGSKERKLLATPISAVQANIIVSKDGNNGTYKTITEAIKAAPQQSKQRTIIYIRAGRYEEKLIKVGKKKTNLMFIGDGIGKTIITGGKSVHDGLTTFHTASFGKFKF
ncbi:hypothetical protein AQUCO_03700168v1 [Aquilegia coerulea]|uniref:Pectinesterase inhibitor domain-containing protein n=1 Tax=Aquilegia coerulea TaxID=218851 RepID=A0A2G5CTU1_AQUCA|nr:hypothetical protein AQUCO_03700168v1 [Aquilegia coerulea]